MPTASRPDRRVERTRECLRRALIALLAERPWDEISVQDICERADVGRSTFYLHYEHKEALLAAGLDGLRAYLSGAGAGTPFGFIDGLVAHVDEQRLVFRSIIGRRSGHTVQRLFRDMIESLVKDDLADSRLPEMERHLAARYVTGGLVEALALWIDTPSGWTAAQMVAYLQRTSTCVQLANLE